jgi:hypothetical protein
MPHKPQSPCQLPLQRRAADWRSPRTRQCVRLTARVSSGRRSLSAPGAVPAPLKWRPACRERAPALALAVQSPSREGAQSIANVRVSSDGSGRSTDGEIIHAAQADVRTRRRRLYPAVRECFARRAAATSGSFPLTARQDPPGTPKLQAIELRQDKSRNVRPGRQF